MPKFIEEFVKTFPCIQIVFRPLGEVIYAFDRFHALRTSELFQRNGRSQSLVQITLFRITPRVCHWLVCCCLSIEHWLPPFLRTQCTMRPRHRSVLGVGIGFAVEAGEDALPGVRGGGLLREAIRVRDTEMLVGAAGGDAAARRAL